MRMKTGLYLLVIWLVLWSSGCGESEDETAGTAVPATHTPVPTPLTSDADDNDNFIVVATDAPNAPFTVFDEFGSVDGFESRLLENIAVEADLDYEIVVTPLCQTF